MSTHNCRTRAVAVTVVLVALGFGLGSIGLLPTSQAASSAPQPSARVVGPLTRDPASPTLAKVESVFKTMSTTVYAHRYVINTTTGYYAWDCVGMADWVLHRAAPNAWRDMHETLRIRPGFVPTPTRWANYLAGANGTLPASDWARIKTISALEPGDYLLFPANPKVHFVGHAVIAAGPPRLMPDGSYALRVFDSTGSAHGSADSRLTDPRAVNHSGLGNGTMRIFVSRSGALRRAKWSINAGGPSMVGVPVIAGRALR